MKASEQLELAARYREGNGVPKSMEEAIKWWTKAAEQGNAVSQFKLGVVM